MVEVRLVVESNPSAHNHGPRRPRFATSDMLVDGNLSTVARVRGRPAGPDRSSARERSRTPSDVPPCPPTGWWLPAGSVTAIGEGVVSSHPRRPRLLGSPHDWGGPRRPRCPCILLRAAGTIIWYSRVRGSTGMPAESAGSLRQLPLTDRLASPPSVHPHLRGVRDMRMSR